MAITESSANTFARIALIQWQFSAALRQTTAITEETLNKLLLGVADDQRWIEKVSIYGLTADNLCRAELTLEIDWDEYNLQISQARVLVAVDEKRWRDNTAPEVSDAIKIFNKFVKMCNLETTWQITYTDQVYQTSKQHASVDRTLGLVTAEPIKWVTTEQSLKITVGELPEITVGLRLTI